MKFIIRETDYHNLILISRIISITDKVLKRMEKVCPFEYRAKFRDLKKRTIFLDINPRIKRFYAYVTMNLEHKTDNISSFNAQYAKCLDKESDERLELIIAHETAHLLDFLIRGDSFHDNEWKLICAYMGGQPIKTVEMDPKNVAKQQKFNDLIVHSKPHQRRKLIQDFLNN